MPVNSEGAAAGATTRTSVCHTLNSYTRATSRYSRGTLRRPSSVLSTTGKNAAMAMKATLAASPRPNHIDSIGIHANSEICLSVWKVGPTSRSAQRDQPSSAPTASPMLEPMPNPQAMRHRLADKATHSSPLTTWPTPRCHTASGDTSRGESDAPEATTAHHTARISTGSTQPRRRGGTLWNRLRCTFTEDIRVPLSQPRLAPAQQPRLGHGQQLVDHKPHDAHGQHGGQHHVQLKELAAIDDEEPNALR